MRNLPWRLLALPEAALAVLAIIVSRKLGQGLPAIMICGALIVLHAFGLPTALPLARRAGIGAERAFLFTLLFGPAWWGPLLFPRSAAGKKELPDPIPSGYSEACPETMEQEGPDRPTKGIPGSSTPSNPADRGDYPSA